MQRVVVGLVVALVAISMVGGFSYQAYSAQQAQIKEANANQLLAYQNAILTDQLAHANQTGKVSGNQSVGSSVQAYASLYIGTRDSVANQTLTKEGFVPNCLAECPGITYYKDPTTLIPNEGHDFIQFELSGAANAITPSTSDRAIYIGLSASTNGATVTDTFSGTAGPCTTNTAIVIGGLYATLSPPGAGGAVVTGAPSAGSVTWTVTYTWTFTPAIGPNTVNAGCLWTHLPGSGNPYIFAEVSGVGPFTLAMGDTLKEVWSITAT